jgi:hypothetical protein
MPPFQFSLRTLAIGVTAIAIGLAAVRAWGPLIAPGMIFLLALLFNGLGLFAAWQRPAWSTRVMLVFYACFLVSFALPVTGFGVVPGGPTTYIYGWQVADMAFRAWFELVHHWLVVRSDWQEVFGRLQFGLYGVANVLIAAYPLMRWRRLGWLARWAPRLMLAAAAYVASYPWDPMYLVGYYVWCGAALGLSSTVRARVWECVLGLAIVGGMTALTLLLR